MEQVKKVIFHTHEEIFGRVSFWVLSGRWFFSNLLPHGREIAVFVLAFRWANLGSPRVHINVARLFDKIGVVRVETGDFWSMEDPDGHAKRKWKSCLIFCRVVPKLIASYCGFRSVVGQELPGFDDSSWGVERLPSGANSTNFNAKLLEAEEVDRVKAYFWLLCLNDTFWWSSGYEFFQFLFCSKQVLSTGNSTLSPLAKN